MTFLKGFLLGNMVLCRQAVTVWRMHQSSRNCIKKEVRAHEARTQLQKEARRLFAAVVGSSAIPSLTKYMTGDLHGML